MPGTKLKSFTLSEMLVVLIITTIVVGMAFSVLNMVQKQVSGIRNNFEKTSRLVLLEQQLWQDFNRHNSIYLLNETITMISVDTVKYTFNESYVLRNADTIPARLTIIKGCYQGAEVPSGYIDAISVSAASELPDYRFFVYSQPDATLKMNQDGI